MSDTPSNPVTTGQPSDAPTPTPAFGEQPFSEPTGDTTPPALVPEVETAPAPEVETDEERELEPHEINENFTGGHLQSEVEETDDPRVKVINGEHVVGGPQPDPTYDDKDGLVGPKAGAPSLPVAVGDLDVPARDNLSEGVDDTTAAQVRSFVEADTANKHAVAAAQAVAAGDATTAGNLSQVPTATLEAEIARRDEVLGPREEEFVDD